MGDFFKPKICTEMYNFKNVLLNKTQTYLNYRLFLKNLKTV